MWVIPFLLYRFQRDYLLRPFYIKLFKQIFMFLLFYFYELQYKIQFNGFIFSIWNVWYICNYLVIWLYFIPNVFCIISLLQSLISKKLWHKFFHNFFPIMGLPSKDTFETRRARSLMYHNINGFNCSTKKCQHL